MRDPKDADHEAMRAMYRYTLAKQACALFLKWHKAVIEDRPDTPAKLKRRIKLLREARLLAEESMKPPTLPLGR